MMNKLLAITMFTFCLLSCNPDPQSTSSSSSSGQDAASLKADIEALNTFFRGQSGKALDRVKAAELVEKSRQFVKAAPKDPLSATYLFRAGEVSRAIGQHEDAVAIFSQMEADYPKDDKTPSALFLKGFTYEDNLKDIDSAKKYYNEFLTKYPDHQLAKQVQQLLEVIDTPPEELIKRFQKKE